MIPCRFNYEHEKALRVARCWGRQVSILFDLPKWSGDHVVQLDRDVMHDEFEWENRWADFRMIRTNHIYGGEDHYTTIFCGVRR